MTDYFEQWQSLSLDDLKKSPVYNRLNRKSRTTAGSTHAEIVEFLKQKVFPLEHKSLADFVYHEWSLYLVSKFHDFPITKLYEYNEAIASAKELDCYKKGGLTGDIQTSNLMVVWKNAAEIGLADFIPLICLTDESDWQNRFSKRLRQAFMYSRLQYIYQEKYLPIAITVSLFPENSIEGHACAFLYVPNNDTLYWNRIFVDSSGASRNPELLPVLNTVTAVMDDRWREFITEKDKYQTDVVKDLDFKDVYEEEVAIADCIRNIQGHHPTCAYWSFGFLVNFLYNYNNHPKIMSDKRSMEHWCTKFETIVTSEHSRTSYFVKLNLIVIIIQRYMREFVWDMLRAKPREHLNVVDFINEFRYPLSDFDDQALVESKQFFDDLHATIRKWNLFHVLLTQQMYEMYDARPPSRNNIRSHPDVKVKEEPFEPEYFDHHFDDPYVEYETEDKEEYEKGLKVAKKLVEKVRKELGVSFFDMADKSIRRQVADEAKNQADVLYWGKIDVAITQFGSDSFYEPKRSQSKERHKKRGRKLTIKGAIQRVMKSQQITRKKLKQGANGHLITSAVHSQYPQFSLEQIAVTLAKEF